MRSAAFRPCVAIIFTLALTSVSFGENGENSDRNEGRNSTLSSDHREEERVLRVLDSRGKVVGPLVSDGVIVDADGVHIYVPIKRLMDSAGHLSASQYAFADAGLAGTQFPTTDCSGPPAILAYQAILRPAQIVRNGTDVTAYIATDTYTSGITLRSYSLAQGQCTLDTFASASQTWSVQTTFSLTQYYPEPLTVSVEIPVR